MKPKTWGTVVALAAVLGIGGGLAWWFNGQTQAKPAAVSSSVVKRKVVPKKPKPVKKKPVAKPKQTAAARQIDAILRANRFVGTALVMHQNKVIFDQGYGYADATQQKKNGPNSIYQLASVQKSFTAGMIMKLAAGRKLALTDPLSTYYPQIAGSKLITLRDMLDMKSGLTLSAFPDKLESENGMLKFVLQNVNSQPKKIGKWNYSPVNFMLLAGIIEQVSGQSYRQYFTENIIRPWHLNHTGFVFNMRHRSSYSQGYQNTDINDVVPNYNRLYGESKASMFYQFGTGQVYMSVHDLFVGERNMLLGKLYPQADAAVLLNPGTASMYGGGAYAYPGYIRVHGLAYGYEATALVSRDGQDGVILLSNYYRANQLSQVPAENIWNLLESGQLK
ncbi:serine hydrolase domain-containing protein [Levilactobacillus tangyuanensis]|uniref:Serine hydrolase domain-containing protein n=1 Tax=Levilactobacillus tangyuanensis TaxID=2486021 RepID=A0ABW1TLT1_9LACO|nr:serine hydrolase domain-containing protein [Levilactobacillus tangyuanensis]